MSYDDHPDVVESTVAKNRSISKSGVSPISKVVGEKLETDADPDTTSEFPCPATTCAGGSLGPPAPVCETGADAPAEAVIQVTRSVTDADPGETDSRALIDYSALDVPGADESDDVEPSVVISTPEQVAEAAAFFERMKAAETKEQNERAHKKSPVYSIMQYRHHPETGEVMLTQEQLDRGFETLAASGHEVVKYAYIWHDQCRLYEVGEDSGEVVCTGLKPAHVHIVVMFDDRPQLRTVSNAFKIPSARVKLPTEFANEHDLDPQAGRGAGPRSFFDLIQYLTHETQKRGGIPGIYQPDRSYWPEKQGKALGGKYQYGRGRVVANFDFGAELDGHMATRAAKSKGGGAGNRRDRKDALRLAVMGGLSLDDAERHDPVMYADDLPRLEHLEKKYRKKLGEQKAKEVGPKRQKSFVLTTGPSRNGKDVLNKDLADEFVALGALAGEKWRIVKPAARNSGEGLDLAEVVLHEDARFTMMPGYSEALTYFEPNDAVAIAARHRNQLPAVQRLTAVSTSEPLESLALTMRARKPSEVLANERATSPRKREYFDPQEVADARMRLALDVTEFLLRIGWHVEVHSPKLAHDHMTEEEFQEFKSNMVMTISRVVDTGVVRLHPVKNRDDLVVGDIKSRHALEPVAVIKGCREAARFLAVSVLRERNQDVVDLIPDDKMQELTQTQVTVETEAAERIVREAEAKRYRAQREIIVGFAEERQRELDKLEKKKRADQELESRRAVCRCFRNHDDAKRYTWSGRLADFKSHSSLDCPLLSPEERGKILEARATRLKGTRDRMAENGFVVPGPGVSYTEELSKARR